MRLKKGMVISSQSSTEDNPAQNAVVVIEITVGTELADAA
jgi:hypothetical protein